MCYVQCYIIYIVHFVITFLLFNRWHFSTGQDSSVNVDDLSILLINAKNTIIFTYLII